MRRGFSGGAATPIDLTGAEDVVPKEAALVEAASPATHSGDGPSGDAPSRDVPSGDAQSGDVQSGDAPTEDAYSGDVLSVDSQSTTQDAGGGEDEDIGTESDEGDFLLPLLSPPPNK
jgi:hypothetical protein